MTTKPEQTYYSLQVPLAGGEWWELCRVNDAAHLASILTGLIGDGVDGVSKILVEKRLTLPG